MTGGKNRKFIERCVNVVPARMKIPWRKSVWNGKRAKNLGLMIDLTNVPLYIFIFYFLYIGFYTPICASCHEVITLQGSTNKICLFHSPCPETFPMNVCFFNLSEPTEEEGGSFFIYFFLNIFPFLVATWKLDLLCSRSLHPEHAFSSPHLPQPWIHIHVIYPTTVRATHALLSRCVPLLRFGFHNISLAPLFRQAYACPLLVLLFCL